MPRPRKRRRICCMPTNQDFGPLEKDFGECKTVFMTVDEFEAIRLIDLEGLSQEECANHMAIARTTAQAIYNSARVKLAECLVNGMKLSIGGGDYFVCEGGSGGYGCKHCYKIKCHLVDEIQ